MTGAQQDASSGPNRRTHARTKASVPVEMETEGSQVPIRGATSDLSLGGCYIETMYPLPTGTHLDLKLQIDGTLLIEAEVVTSDPQVGNGIKFLKMLPEDQEELKAYLEQIARAQGA